jgi:hypothetical protein
MHVRCLEIINIRSIEQFELRFEANELAGWHVVLGANGAGKSSVVRSLSLALTGPKEAGALRQEWSAWTRFGSESSSIKLQVECGSEDIFTGTGRRTSMVEVELQLRPTGGSYGPRVELDAPNPSKGLRSVWGINAGWFSASFGPFRRFTGGDQAFDRLFYTNPRLAPHLSAFGEDVALTEGLRWLRDLRVRQLEQSSQESSTDDGALLGKLIEFLNQSELLPHGAQIVDVRSEEVVVLDAGGARVVVEQLSDGYRSVLSMIFEILRQMTRSYGTTEMIRALDVEHGCVRLPGVVAIDEVDAHLHPSWQKDIGPWFTRCFPDIQFIVTTHSPIICRNATSVWRLPNPGSDEAAGRIQGSALDRLIFGSILDAYGTEFFGRDIARSEDSKELLREMAVLNRKALKNGLKHAELDRLQELQRTLPTSATATEAA